MDPGRARKEGHLPFQIRFYPAAKNNAKGIASEKFHVTASPTTFIVDKTGKGRRRHRWLYQDGDKRVEEALGKLDIPVPSNSNPSFPALNPTTPVMKLFATLASLVLASPPLAADSGFKPLFNGKDLTGCISVGPMRPALDRRRWRAQKYCRAGGHGVDS